MSTSVTWPGGGTDPSATAYAIPAAGELNWSALSAFLIALGQSAQGTSFQKFGIRKATTSPITVAVTDCIVVSKLAAPGAVTANLPAGATKQLFIIVDGTGDAATNNITINRAGSDTIRGATTYVISQNYGWVILCYNVGDTDWKVVAEGSKIATLTASRALVSDSAGNVAVSTVSTTQLQYLASATGTSGTTSTNVVFSTGATLTNATLVTPALGTPSSGNLSSCTGYPFSAVTGTASSSQVATATFTEPTVTRYTTGSGNFTASTSPRAPLYMIVEMIGGGGGGGSSGTAAGTAPTNGSNTTFTANLTAGGGTKGAWAGTAATGAGGTNTASIGTVLANVPGGAGQGASENAASGCAQSGGMGGSGAYGGAGAGGGSTNTGSKTGGDGATNSGAGGGGAGTQTNSTSYSGSGGGAGGFLRVKISAPSGTYAYSVGDGGSASGTGTNGGAGGAGAKGCIVVTEYYQ